MGRRRFHPNEQRPLCWDPAALSQASRAADASLPLYESCL
jgi:hypothetical protein